MAEPTWNTQELPVLEAVRAGEEAGTFHDSDSATEVAGFQSEAGGWLVQSLVEAGYLTGIDASSGGAAHDFYINLRLTERGRRAIGQWPEGVPEAFFAELDRRIEATTDPDDRSRLERFRATAADVAKQVVAGAIVAAGQVGLQ